MSNTNNNDSTEEQHHSDHPRMGDNRRRAEHATREGSGGAGRPDSEHGEHDGHDDGHGGGMHAGHEQLFKRRFFVNLVLSIPVLLYSEGFQALVGFSVPSFPGSEWLSPLFAVIVFWYGGVPLDRKSVV